MKFLFVLTKNWIKICFSLTVATVISQRDRIWWIIPFLRILPSKKSWVIVNIGKRFVFKTFLGYFKNLIFSEPAVLKITFWFVAIWNLIKIPSNFQRVGERWLFHNQPLVFLFLKLRFLRSKRLIVTSDNPFLAFFGWWKWNEKRKSRGKGD